MCRKDSSPQWQPKRSPSEEFFLAAQEFQNLTPPSFGAAGKRRQQVRTPRSISVSIQPLDQDFHPDGDVFWVVSRDISLRGLGLICFDPIFHDYVKIGLPSERISAIGQIRHNTSIGFKYPLYLVGIEFLN